MGLEASVENEDSMRECGALSIPLSRGKFAIINTQDWHLIADRVWYAKRGKAGNWYAVAGSGTCVRGRALMHSIILGTNSLIDHKDGDGLNNRRGNLRETDIAHNNQNRHPENGRALKGFYWDKALNKYRTQIRVGGVQHHVGLFSDELDAAQAYDNAALKYYGEFARLNFPKDGVS